VTRAGKNVALLSALQALMLINNATALTLGPLVGYELADDKSLATLPITGWVVGGTLTTFSASLLMKRIGRRAGFACGVGAGVLGAAAACVALFLGSFWLFVAGSTVYGVYNAFGAYYRFAAVDATGPDGASRAIGYVLAGGLAGGVVGPMLSRVTIDLLPTPYLGAYLALIGFQILALVPIALLRLPVPIESREPGRPLAAIVAQPVFVVAALCAALGYGVMNFLMTATPLAMGACGHDFGDTALVISSHVAGMFAPSFFTGHLVKRFGAPRIVLAGVLLNLGCIAVGLAGLSVPHFWWSLLLLGVGWNFVYIGSTALLGEAHGPAEKAKTQGANDLAIFAMMALSSFGSGRLLARRGWWSLNYASIPLVLAMGAAVLWLLWRRRPAPA
jgi:MFS family permease